MIRWRGIERKSERSHNFTVLGKSIVDRSKILIGNGTYGEITVYQFDDCSIAPEQFSAELRQILTSGRGTR